MSNINAGIGCGQMTVVDEHIVYHKHIKDLYNAFLAGAPHVKLHDDLSPRYDSNFWLNTIMVAPSFRIVGQGNAYKTVVKDAVGGAAGLIHVAESAIIECQPNDDVEALRVFLDPASIEARPLWKLIQKQPVCRNSSAYVNYVADGLFKTRMCLPSGPCVTDEDVR